MRKGDLTIAFKAIGLSELPPAHKRVATALLDHYNRHTHRCDPSMETLATLLGVSRRSVARAMKRLERDGFFKTYRHGGNFHCNQYAPIWPRFREVDAAWDQRRRGHRERFSRANLSPSPRQLSHTGDDADVIQTCSTNQSYVTCSDGLPKKGVSEATGPRDSIAATTMELIAKSSQRSAKRFHVKHPPARDAAREAAHRRWDNTLLKLFARDKGLYARIIEAIDQEMVDSTTDAELRKRGSGIDHLIGQLQARGLSLQLPGEADVP